MLCLSKALGPENLQNEYLRECDGSRGEYLQRKKDDETVRVHQNITELQHHRQDRHGNRHLREGGEEPCQPVHGVVQTHHLHHLKRDDLLSDIHISV